MSRHICARLREVRGQLLGSLLNSHLLCLYFLCMNVLPHVYMCAMCTIYVCVLCVPYIYVYYMCLVCMCTMYICVQCVLRMYVYYVYYVCMCTMCVCVLCVQCMYVYYVCLKPVEVRKHIGSPHLEVQIIVICHMVIGNQTWILCKSRECSWTFGQCLSPTHLTF